MQKQTKMKRGERKKQCLLLLFVFCNFINLLTIQMQILKQKKRRKLSLITISSCSVLKNASNMKTNKQLKTNLMFIECESRPEMFKAK